MAVRKTTVYLTDELKNGVEREAQRRGCSEAEVIRAAIAQAVRHAPPRAAILDGEPIAERVDELLEGFGTR